MPPEAPESRAVQNSGPAEEPPNGPRIGEDEGRRALLVDGVVQSVALDGGAAEQGYWGAMLPDVRPRRALLLGYGAGALAHLLYQRFGPLPIVGVDDDPRVLALAPSLLPPLHGVEIVVADAFVYLRGEIGRFDYVALDLFRGAEIPRGVFSRPFLRRLREVLTPGGTLVVNIFRDRRSAERLQRLASLFRQRQLRAVGANLVIHLKS